MSDTNDSLLVNLVIAIVFIVTLPLGILAELLKLQK